MCAFGSKMCFHFVTTEPFSSFTREMLETILTGWCLLCNHQCAATRQTELDEDCGKSENSLHGRFRTNVFPHGFANGS